MVNTTKDSTVNKIGFYSAILTAIFNIAYFVSFIRYLPILNSPWPGLEAYVVAFKPLPFLAWVIPCFFLAPAFLVTIACLYIKTEETKKIWGLLALVFATAYMVVISTHYFIQMTMVSHNLVFKVTEGLSMWLYPFNIPYNIPLVLEGVGYSFMIVSVITAAMVFGGGKLEQWTRWSLVGVGVTGLVLPVSLLVTLPGILVPVSLGANGMLLTVAPVLLAILFRQDRF